LLVEDSRTDVFLIRESLTAAGVRAEIDVVHDGQAAMQFLDEGTLPALVLLDLNLPKYSGREVLRHLRANPRTKDLTVLVVTSSALSQDRQDLEALGFNGYFQKPSDYAEFMKLGSVVKGLLEPEE
jgi:chemotaxis family two-component system response regulator Rcp1